MCVYLGRLLWHHGLRQRPEQLGQEALGEEEEQEEGQPGDGREELQAHLRQDLDAVLFL